MSGDTVSSNGRKLALNRLGCDKMSENLRETIEKNEAILADPNATMEERRFARMDLAVSRRLIAKGVELLEDGPGA